MTRQHRQAHVWLWFAVAVTVGAAFALWVIQPRGEP